MSAVVDAINYLLTRAKASKVEIEVMGVHRKNTNIAFSERKLDQFAFSETRQLGIRVIDGAQEGVAYSESLETESLDTLLADGIANSRMIKQEWPSELRAAAQLAAMNEIYNPELEAVPVEKKIELAEKLESAALDVDSRLTVPYSRYSDSFGEVWLANTRGLMGNYKTNSCVAWSHALVKEGDTGVMDGEHDSQRRFQDLNPEKIAKTAAQLTLARLGGVRPTTGRYTVVFDNYAAETLFGYIGSYFSAKAVDEMASPLRDKLGQQVFSKHLTIVDDPFAIRGAASRPFDDEGFESKKTTLIENGVLKSYLTNSVFAKKMKLPHTASASRSPSTELDIAASNLYVQPGSQSPAQLLASDKKVILITGILGSAGVRRTSGDFSIPVEGFMYENGQRGAPLKDFLISGNLLQLLTNVSAVGNDLLTPLGTIICPSLLVHDVNVAGQS